MDSYQNLSLAEQQQILLEVAKDSLPAWNIKGQISLIKQRENAVYAVTTEQGEKFALRVHRSDYHSDRSLQSELTWMQALHSFGLGVPEIIETTDGSSFTVTTNERLNGLQQVDLLAWVEGKQIGSVEDGLGQDTSKIHDIYFSIGEIAARIHNHSEQWSIPEGFERHAWDQDGLVGEDPFWGRFWELEALTDEQRELQLQGRAALREDLTTFAKSDEFYGLIHADLVPENVMASDNQVNIIDFDDAGFGWYLFELATALYFIQEDENYPTAKSALIDGYRSLRELSDETLAHLPMFLAARSTTYLGWVRTREKTETAMELTPILIEMSCSAINRYLKSRDHAAA